MTAHRPSQAPRTGLRLPPGDGRYPAGGLIGATPTERRRLTAQAIVPSALWGRFLIPTELQRWDDCVVNGSTAWAEAAFRELQGDRAIPAGMQIDTQPFYDHARRKHYPGEPIHRGGLLLHHGIEAMSELGALPPDTSYPTIDVYLATCSTYLLEGPVLQGTATHAGWATPATNGAIRARDPDHTRLHLTLLTGILEQRERFFPQLMNSHGQHWGYYGYGLLTQEDWEASVIGIVVPRLPPGSALFDGYKRFLVPHRRGS